MIRTLTEISDCTLSSLSFAGRPYAADTLTESQLASREITKKDRKLFDDLDDHYEDEGNKKLADKVGKTDGKKKKEDPFAETPDSEDGDGDGEDLDMEDF